jgi:hypothetical protein
MLFFSPSDRQFWKHSLPPYLLVLSRAPPFLPGSVAPALAVSCLDEFAAPQELFLGLHLRQDPGHSLLASGLTCLLVLKAVD